MGAEDRRLLDEQQRRKVLGGLAAALAQKGYLATTIADIVAVAGVSKSTFYAHFIDKEAAFLALYSAGADQVIAVIEREDAAAAAAGKGWEERVDVVASAYFGVLAEGGEVTRVLLGEVAAISPQSRALRREVFDRYVSLFVRLAEDVVGRHPELRMPSRSLLLAGIGGMNELMLRAVEDDQRRQVEQLTSAAAELVAAIMRAP